MNPLYRAYLAVEFTALFAVMPLGLARRWIRLPLIPSLWAFTLVCLTLLLSDPTFNRGVLWQMGDPAPLWLGLACFVPAALALLLIVWRRNPTQLFSLPRHRPWLWALIVILYPILSVYPQGIIYRGFIFHRYAELFPSRFGMICVSAIAFGLMHMAFRNWKAPLLTLIGGFLFAIVYSSSDSLVEASIVHSAFGCWVFTVGLGHHFYGGTTALLSKERERG